MSVLDEHAGRRGGAVVQRRSQGAHFGRSAPVVGQLDATDAPPIDCASRLALCRGACCKLSFALSTSDIEAGIVRWDPDRPYLVAQQADRRCVHQEPATCRCGIYEQRPLACRSYDCRGDTRIWLDFEARVPSPELEHPDWPVARLNDRRSSDVHSAAVVTVDESWRVLAEVIDERAPARARSFLGRTLSRLGRLPHPSFNLLGYELPAYGSFVCAGSLLGLLFALALAHWLALSIPVMLANLVVGVAVAYGVGLATKALLGAERFTYFHYQVAVLGAAGVVTWLAGAPLAPYMGLTCLGLNLTQSIGRLGCLTAGCCHGLPYTWGVAYTREHGAIGFPRHLIGTRLLPVQLFEALGLALLVAGVSVALVSEILATTALLPTLLLGQSGLRFWLEFLRGDPGRSYSMGLSEGQWTSMGLTLAAFALGASGVFSLPLRIVLVWLMLLAIGAVAVAHFRAMHFGWFGGARAVSRLAVATRELASALISAPFASVAGPPGLRLSATAAPGHDEARVDIAFSSERAGISDADAVELGRVVMRCWPIRATRSRLIVGHRRVFHLILDLPPAPLCDDDRG